MRERLLLNKEWHYLPEEKETDVPKTTIAGMYLSAKTERLKWGPGAYKHQDEIQPWNLDGDIPAEPWTIVNLPHDYIISQSPKEAEGAPRGFFTYHNAWYRKHITVPKKDEGKRITIFFEGISGISEIYFNGCFMKHNNGSYNSFEIDVTDYVRYDEDNVISVYINPNSYEAWWYTGGGIYRNVWLVKTEDVAVDLWGVYAPTKKTDTGWDVDVETTLKSISYSDCDVIVENQLISPDGECVDKCSVTASAAARTTTVIKTGLTIDTPQLWDIGSPNLYTVRTIIYRDGEAIDLTDTKIGFRTIELTPDKGMSINGRRIKLKGVCLHHDFGLTGKALPDNICRYRVEKIKEMGTNAIRMAHYPHNAATMDACDELGLLVMNETRRFESCPESMEALEMLIKRDRNRPSVFIWCTGNEEEVYHTLPQGAKIHRAMEHKIKSLDTTRPVTSAVAYLEKATVFDALEVIGANYRLKELESVHNRYPDKPFISTENCAVGSTRGVYYGDDMAHAHLDERDRDRNPDTWYYGREGTWKFIMEHDWNSGAFQWNATDYRGEAEWPRLCASHGAFDMFMQRKDAFYQNLSHWSDEPMVHILPHWNHEGLEEREINVWAYTNCDECELILNGESLGIKKVEKYTHLQWCVKYTPGKLEAIGYIDGTAVANDCHVTTGRATALRLKSETPEISANGQDIAIFSCYATDSDGLSVPNATGMIRFSCHGGTLIGTGSDPSDHIPVPSPDRQMMAGLVTVAVKPDEGADSITLYAQSDTMTQTALTLDLGENNLRHDNSRDTKSAINIVTA